MRIKSLKNFGKALLIGSIGSVVLTYQACTGGFTATTMGEGSFESTAVRLGDLIPRTDKYDSTCRTNAAYDACIIQQNPLARGTVLDPDPAKKVLQIGEIANYGVKLTSLGAGGFLENATISVQTLKSPRVSVSPTEFKAPFSAQSRAALEQVNAYYWINRTAEYFDIRTEGRLPAMGKNIKVIVDDNLTGYDAAKNTIRMKSNEETFVPLSGDIAVHLFGVANVMLANPSGWAKLSAEKHVTCEAVDSGCCKALSGCANAIRFGVGEYFAASMFPEHTRIGEAIVNTGHAQVISSVTREIASLSTHRLSQVFMTSKGSAQAMGLIYASMWWEIRKAPGSKIDDIDRIFIEHLALLDGNDDFRSAIMKAKSVDQRLFDGRNSAKFDNQLAGRGL